MKSFSKWQMPTAIEFVAEIPKTRVGHLARSADRGCGRG
jgi:hypothetical protein